MSMSAWGYGVNSRAEALSSNIQQQQDPLQQAEAVNRWKLRRESECGWSAGRDLDGLFQSEEAMAAGGRSRFNYMDDAAFNLEDDADASVVTSSYHFSLSDVGADLFDQPATPMKQMDVESWEAINNLNNLGDMDDIFGNSSSFVTQQNMLEVPSVSSSLADSAMTMRGGALSCCGTGSPRVDKHAASVPSLVAPQNCLNKPVYWLAQQPCQEQTSNISCEDYEAQPPIIIPPDLIPGVQHQQQLQNPGICYKPIQPRRESGEVIQQSCTGAVSAVERRAASLRASTSAAVEIGPPGSLEATVLYQLGSTMSRLDAGTRLSIRNALYRLAKSASSRTVDGEESSPQSTARSLRNSLETCTNPIDRTVASLLFYKQEQQPDGATSGSVSPQSTISSNGCTWPEAMVDHERVPVVMMVGNKLPLPPVYYTSGYPSGGELMSSKRGRRK